MDKRLCSVKGCGELAIQSMNSISNAVSGDGQMVPAEFTLHLCDRHNKEIDQFLYSGADKSEIIVFDKNRIDYKFGTETN